MNRSAHAPSQVQTQWPFNWHKQSANQHVNGSLPPSRPPSLSSSPTTGRPAGSPLTPRRTPRTPRRTRSGLTLASGQSRSLMSSRALRATRVWSSRTPQHTTPSQPSSLRRLTPRASLWLSSMRSSCRVSSVYHCAPLPFQSNANQHVLQMVSSAVVPT